MKVAPNNFRFQSDRRQFGGILMLLGFCAIIQPLANIVSGFGPDGANATDPGEIPFWGLFGGLCLFITGIVAVIAGYLATAHDWSHKYLTLFLMFAIQTAWIGYMTDMVNVGKGATVPASMNGFIPLEYDPTDADVRFVGAMGILAILTHGFAFVGSIAFMVWSLHAYNTGMPEDRSGDYFKGRMSTYTLALSVAGLVQLLLGIWCAARFESNVLDQGPVRAAFLIVTYPALSIFVGLIELINGTWGFARSKGLFIGGADDNSYAMSLGFQWVSVLVLQIVCQIAYLPGGMLAQVAPTVAALTLGLSVMPAFLDQKMRSLPAMLPANYYSDVTASEEDDSSAIGVDDKAADDAQLSTLSV